MDVVALVEILASIANSQVEDKILLARLLGISTKGNKIPFSGDNVLQDSIPSSHRVRKRLASGRGKLAAGIAEMCAASCNTVQILFGVLSSCGPGVGPKVRAVLFSLELRWRGLKERLSGVCVVFDILC